MKIWRREKRNAAAAAVSEAKRAAPGENPNDRKKRAKAREKRRRPWGSGAWKERRTEGEKTSYGRGEREEKE
jgi:hypothetical protein